MADSKPRLHYTLALALGSSFTLVSLIGAAIFGIVVYFAVSQLLRAELEHRLSHVGGVAALHIDAEKHELLRDPEDENSDYYKELKATLQDAQSRSDDVAYVYTVRMTAEGETVWEADDAGNMIPRPAGAGGEVVFIVDSDPLAESYGRIGEAYVEAPELLSQALLGTAQPNRYGVYVTQGFYTDQWGTFLSGWVPILGKDGRALGMLGTDISADAVLARERDFQLLVVVLGAIVAVITIPIGLVFAAWIRNPLREVSREMDRISILDLDHEEVIASRITEVDQMGRELDDMKKGLRSFRKYVPAQLVRKLLELGVEAELGGAEEEVSIFFSDIAGFTSIAEKLSPEQLVEYLGEYLSTLTETLLEYDATVDKYIGDGVMAFWNAPAQQPEHAYLACRATLECMKRIGELNRRWEQEGRGVMLRTRFGVHTGKAIVGNMGSRQRLAYTLLGDNVNLASRLEGANKAYGTEVLVSAATYEKVKGRILGRRIDRVAVKGRAAPIDCYELVGVEAEVDHVVIERVATYERGFDLYVSRRFSEAAAAFRELLEADPEDTPAEVMRTRCLEYEQNAPPEDWDGGHTLTEK